MANRGVRWIRVRKCWRVIGAEQAIRAGDGSGAARSIFNQRHFAENVAGSKRFEQLTVDQNIHLTFNQDVEDIAWLALLENGLAGGKNLMFFDFVETIRASMRGFSSCGQSTRRSLRRGGPTSESNNDAV